MALTLQLKRSVNTREGRKLEYVSEKKTRQYTNILQVLERENR